MPLSKPKVVPASRSKIPVCVAFPSNCKAPLLTFTIFVFAKATFPAMLKVPVPFLLKVPARLKEPPVPQQFEPPMPPPETFVVKICPAGMLTTATPSIIKLPFSKVKPPLQFKVFF